MEAVHTRDELARALGGTYALERAIAAGAWQRVLRGAYVPGGLRVDLAVRAVAAARLLPPAAVVAGRSVLWLHGVDVLAGYDDRLEVLVPRGAVVPRRSGLSAREGVLLPGDADSVRGVPALRPARASVDVMRLGRLPEAVVVADAVQHARLVSGDEIGSELERHRGLRGVLIAREALRLSDPRAESPPESRVRLVLCLAGFRPVPQYDVLDRYGQWLARVDLAFPAERLAVEYDGRDVHLRGDVFAHDRRRQNALLAAGWLVLRYTAADLRWPASIVGDVRAALATRRAA